MKNSNSKTAIIKKIRSLLIGMKDDFESLFRLMQDTNLKLELVDNHNTMRINIQPHTDSIRAAITLNVFMQGLSIAIDIDRLSAIEIKDTDTMKLCLNSDLLSEDGTDKNDNSDNTISRAASKARETLLKMHKINIPMSEAIATIVEVFLQKILDEAGAEARKTGKTTLFNMFDMFELGYNVTENSEKEPILTPAIRPLQWSRIEYR